MAGVPASNETPSRRALRMAVGTAIGFIISQLAKWPVAHLMPVVVVGILMHAAPFTYSEAWKIFRGSVFFFFIGGLIAWLFTPWPPVLALICGVMLYYLAHYMLTSGANLLLIVSCLVGFVAIPIVVTLLPAVGFIAAAGFSLDWGVGLLVAWLAWLIVPRNAPLPDEHHAELSQEEARYLAGTLTIIGVPLVLGFIIFSYAKVLIAIYAVLMATAFSSAGGRQSGLKYLVANACYGAVGMLICYELFVMVPEITFVFPVIVVAAYVFGYHMFRGGPTAGYWESGTFGFLIMLGGILMKDDVIAASTLIERLWQLVLATTYVTAAYALLELFRHWKHKLTPKKES